MVAFVPSGAKEPNSTHLLPSCTVVTIHILLDTTIGVAIATNVVLAATAYIKGLHL